MKHPAFERLYRRLDAAEAALEELSAQGREGALEARVRRVGTGAPTPLEEGLEVLRFRTCGRPFAVPVEALDQVLDARGLNALPGLPRHVLGALVARGRVVPVLDLRVLLGLRAGVSDLTRLLVVHGGGHPFALAVEALDLQLRLPSERLRPPPPGPWLFETEEGVPVLDVAALKAPAGDAVDHG